MLCQAAEASTLSRCAKCSDSYAMGLPNYGLDLTRPAGIALHIAAVNPKSPGALLQQPFLKDPQQQVSHRLYVVSSLLKTPIRITRFVRYDAGA